MTDTVQPYYADALVTLYLGDCREIAAWLDADVLVTDPPYGVAYTSGRVEGRRRSSTRIENDDATVVRDVALAMWGAPRPALVFGTWKAPRPAATRQVLIWDKTAGNGMGTGIVSSPWGSCHEEIYLLGTWPPIAPGGRTREGGVPSRTSGVLRVANYNTQAQDRPQHPTPKPLPLMEALLAKCPPGTIADPFAGSGSTLVTAKRLGRPAIGVEVDERYCEMAARRLAQDYLGFGESA